MLLFFFSPSSPGGAVDRVEFFFPFPPPSSISTDADTYGSLTAVFFFLLFAQNKMGRHRLHRSLFVGSSSAYLAAALPLPFSFEPDIRLRHHEARGFLFFGLCKKTAVFLSAWPTRVSAVPPFLSGTWLASSLPVLWPREIKRSSQAPPPPPPLPLQAFKEQYDAANSLPFPFPARDRRSDAVKPFFRRGRGRPTPFLWVLSIDRNHPHALPFFLTNE